jgi:hypothetical protein
VVPPYFKLMAWTFLCRIEDMLTVVVLGLIFEGSSERYGGVESLVLKSSMNCDFHSSNGLYFKFEEMLDKGC